MTLLTWLVAVFVAYVTWRQMYIARRKLILDLFDRRYQVFTATEEFLAKAANGNLKLPGPDEIKFLQETSHARFLFESDVTDAINEIGHTAYKRWTLEQTMPATGDIARAQNISQQSQVAEEMRNRLAGLAELFGPYMRITDRLGASWVEAWWSRLQARVARRPRQLR
jgi:hypothetical protein